MFLEQLFTCISTHTYLPYHPPFGPPPFAPPNTPVLVLAPFLITTNLAYGHSTNIEIDISMCQTNITPSLVKIQKKKFHHKILVNLEGRKLHTCLWIIDNHMGVAFRQD